APAYFTSKELFTRLMLEVFINSLNHGIFGGSGMGISSVGLISCAVLGEYKKGNAYGKVAIAVSERFHDMSALCVSDFAMGCFINHWRRPVRKNIQYLKDGYMAALEGGNIVYAGYCMGMHIEHLLHSGYRLTDVVDQCEKYLVVVRGMKREDMFNFITIARHMAVCLMNQDDSPVTFNNRPINEYEFLQETRDEKNWLIYCYFIVIKTPLCYFNGDYQKALELALKLDDVLDNVFGQFNVIHHYFYLSLIIFALYPNAAPPEKKRYMKILNRNLKKMKTWADNCQENCQHKYFLMAAGMSALLGKDHEAGSLFDKAIESAAQNEFIQDEGIANELSARFHLERGNSRIARFYLKEAHHSYTLWGATAKVNSLESEFPFLIVQPKTQKISGSTEQSSGYSSELLNLSTVMKSSFVLSGEIHLDSLLTKMLSIMMENAGAQNGAMILKDKEGLWIEAQQSAEHNVPVLLERIPLAGNEKGIELPVPVTVVNYVDRTQENVVLINAGKDERFHSDPYIAASKPKSILCFPIIHQGKISGILYLENNLATGVFTQEHLDILKLLSVQAAISIENARLYEGIIQSRIALQESEEKYRGIFETATEGIFQSTPDGRILTINPAGARLLGYESPEEVLESITDIGSQLYVDPAKRTEVIKLLQKHGVITGFELKLRRKDGDTVDVSMNIHEVRDEDQNLLYFEGLLEDIT
ncbi:MAG: PAS domain S-box protein, partial [Thermodesulfovibrionia bacterium]|nr:PAS domain S-box protein [Thermodesulfovibrionia bacterium]